MGFSRLLLILGFVLNVAHCLESMDRGENPDIKTEHNVIGILGEDAYLSCQYLGQDPISSALWKRKLQTKSKILAGFKNNNAFSREPDFSIPASATNLTVKMTVSSVEAEGEYTCVFASDEEEFASSVRLTVLVQPDIHTLVTEETVGGTNYQSVLCSAVGGRPMPQISWRINGIPPLSDHFTVTLNETNHPDDTASISSILRFATHLQDHDSVTCMVQHPTLLNPKLTTVEVNTYVSPNVTIAAMMVTEEESEYFAVTCMASGGRPEAAIALVVDTDEELQGENDTSSDVQTTSYRLPAQLYEGHNITCAFDHPKLTHRELRSLQLPAFFAPNVTIAASMVTEEESEYFAVTCVASGGRPEAAIALLVDTDEELQGENDTSSDVQTTSYRLPAQLYEGHNITCAFDHPKLTHRELRSLQLPAFYISELQLLHSGLVNTSNKVQAIDSLEVMEGERDFTIGLHVIGNAPRYTVSCTKDNEPLPLNVEVVGSALTVQGPVGLHHAGLYTCVASFHKHRASVQIDITVKPEEPDLIPPTITVDLWNRPVHRVIECLAANAVPAANVSWLLPEGVADDSRLNFTSHNGSHSVRAVLVLPACWPQERTAQCVIDHPVFEKPQHRRITLPLCVPPNITTKYSTEWRGGEEHAVVQCHVESVATAAAISWHTGETDTDNSTSHVEEVETQREIQASGLVMASSTVRFPSTAYAGQNLTCVVEHQSLEEPERRDIHIPLLIPPNITTKYSTEWRGGEEHAVVQCRVESVATAAAISWQTGETGSHLKEVRQREIQASGLVMASSTVRFLSSAYAGQNLTCVVEHQSLEEPERREIHIPLLKSPMLSVSVVTQQNSPIWLAECDYRAEGAEANLSWLLPENSPGQTSVQSMHEGQTLHTRLTYQFPLADLEGQDLTCVIQRSGMMDRRTIHIPRFYIYVGMLNHTTRLQTRHGTEHMIHRLVLQKNLHSQRLLLNVSGNVPTYNLTCQRGDGSLVQMKGDALVFQSKVTEQDEGLYICVASFHHHKAKLYIQVEVVSEEKQYLIVIIIGMCSATALALLLGVTLWVLCCRNNGSRSKHSKKRESLAALTTLMSPPCSPELKKMEGNGQEYAQLVSYSIVIDVKSTV